MKYYWVFQNKTFKDECAGSFLWAPKCNDRIIRHWSTMLDLKIGDIVIHSNLGKIVAIGEITKESFICDQPKEFKHNNRWGDEGYKALCRYKLLDVPLTSKSISKKIYRLQPNINGPFNRIGKGNTGYLFDLNSEAFAYIKEELKKIGNKLE